MDDEIRPFVRAKAYDQPSVFQPAILMPQAHAIPELHERGPLTQRGLVAALGLQKSPVGRTVIDGLTLEEVARAQT